MMPGTYWHSSGDDSLWQEGNDLITAEISEERERERERERKEKKTLTWPPPKIFFPFILQFGGDSLPTHCSAKFPVGSPKTGRWGPSGDTAEFPRLALWA
jgi:hypothetical protein